VFAGAIARAEVGVWNGACGKGARSERREGGGGTEEDGGEEKRR
jgi:hypothetical protein